MAAHPALGEVKKAHRSAGARASVQRVSIGTLTVTVPRPTKTQMQDNVRRSTDALGRALARLARPGIRLRPRRGVPLFRVDDDDPGILIRDLDGKQQRGTFEDGEFRPIA